MLININLHPQEIMKCNFLLFLLIVPFFALAGSDDPRLEKKINREFSIRSDGRVELDNRYGNIDIAIGSSNQVKIDVTIAATAPNERRAQEMLNKVTIAFEEGNNRVSARTDIGSNTSWTSWLTPGKTEIDIHYQVSVPADVYLDLVNRFGNIYLETTNRDLEIDLSYGDLRLGDINAKLKLTMMYSEGSISQIKEGNLQMAYSELEMEDASQLDLDMKYGDIVSGTIKKLNLTSSYSDLEANEVSMMTYTGKYDDVEIDRVEMIVAETGYTDIVIGELTQDATFNMRYGDLTISNIRRGFSKINLNTSYAGVMLNFMKDAGYTLDVNVNYCDVRENPDMKISERIEKPTNVVLKGTHLGGGGTVYARMNYGELILD